MRLGPFFLAVWMCAGQNGGEDILLRAMQDELERAGKINLADLEKPYFIEYLLDDVSIISVSSALGALISKGETRVRIPRVRMRVGDYSFDNTNYVYSDLSSGARYDPQQFPLDDNYSALRVGWWLATDRAYKTAVEAIARKRAALKNLTTTENLPDFWKAEPARRIGPAAENKPGGLDTWTPRIRKWSSMFSKYPSIVQSSVNFSSSRSTFYLANSEGSALRRAEPLVNLQAHAIGFASDGSLVRDSVLLPRVNEAALPAEAEVEKMLMEAAENVTALGKAPMGENYAGPVLFEGVAGAQIFAELLVPNLRLARKPVAEPGRPLPFVASEFEGRLESRVLPDFLDVIDDPARSEWQGQELMGHYEIDEEAVVPRPLTLIEKGRLKSFLLTRQPVAGFQASNGRARLPGAFGARTASATNLFIQSSESVSSAELKARFLKMIADRGKPWGLIIRKMDFPSAATSDEVRRLAASANQPGGARIVSAPVLAWKIYPDGREELVRGLRFRGLSVRALRDITAVSTEQFALHYLNNQAPMALVSSGGYVAPVSVVAPAALFDELELERVRDEVPTLPIVPAPPLNAVNASR